MQIEDYGVCCGAAAAMRCEIVIFKLANLQLSTAAAVAVVWRGDLL